MTGRQAVQTAMEQTRDHLAWMVSDLSDADLLVRPLPGANHAAWQIGNVIGGDLFLVQSELPDAAFPALPAGFLELHGASGAANDGADGFLTKAEYLDLLTKVRAASIAAVDTLTDADLHRPASEKAAGLDADVGARAVDGRAPHDDARGAVHRDPPQARQAGAAVTRYRKGRHA